MATKTTDDVTETAADTTGDSTDQPLSPEQRRTFLFVGGAIVCLAITGIIEWSSRPVAIEDFGKVSQPFYADFTDPTLATSLEVYVFDTDIVRPLDFRVERLENGRWAIPSHHNYPADAEDQLAKTASTIIGITRGAMVSRWKADHAQYGVVNPKQDALSVGDIEGIGKRIVLKGDDDSVLADYIIGNKVEGESSQYHVRHPDEDEVYIVELDIDLSTKFTDWIETDLLEIDGHTITEMTINDHSFEELQGRLQVTKSEISTFQRKTSSDPWTLDSLNDEVEEIDKDAISDTVNTIGDLEIVGVRPKQQGLTPDLKLDRENLQSQQDVQRLQSDLLTRGFLLRSGENDNQENLQLIAREGEMYAANDQGLIYRLHFGRAFAGSQEELEIGLSSSDSDPQKKTNKTASTGDEVSQESNQDEEESTTPEDATQAPTTDADTESSDKETETIDSNTPGRYVFVRVEFDEKYLGDKPDRPIEPEQPAALKESVGAKENVAGPEDSADEESTEEEPQGEEAPDSEEKEEDTEKNEDDPLAEIRKTYEEAKKKYDDDLKEYERESTEHEEKVTKGEETAEKLNRRFAAWYYVISGDSFDKLRLSRSDLVKAKEQEEEEEEEHQHELSQVLNETATDSDQNLSTTNQMAADEFLKENKSKEGVISTDSGLQYTIIEAGEGESPTASSTVKVAYRGTLLDGTVFDESSEEGIEFGVDKVIRGWTEALQLMKPGAKWRLFIPPDLAYGEQGSGNKIGPNTLLMFEVELITFN